MDARCSGHSYRENDQTYDLWQVDHTSIVLKDSLGNNEPPTRSRVPPILLILLLDALQDSLQRLVISVIVPFHVDPRNLNPFLNGEVAASIGYYDVSTFAECWDDGRDRRETLSVIDRGGNSEELGDISF